MNQIPNILTLGNLFCGCCALLYTLYWQPEVAALFTAGSFVFDYLDGMAARALKASSPVGKELDSLADMVSFGAVPGAMLFRLISGEPSISAAFGPSFVDISALPAFVLSAFSALRLAKFNLDSRQTNYFLGLSTPASTVFVLGLTLAAHYDRFGLTHLLHNRWLLYGITAVLSLLLISEIPMFGMKIRRLNWKDNIVNIGFVLFFALLFFQFRELAFSIIILFYILVSIALRQRVLEA